ncbi:hypothetical protein GCM10009557_11550 [Virgisporangium ochraceum]|uniref:Uncharacterized protein n=1 Tax=Virgisporangium ochraceum TaxID=65505 RepID=A0A8J4ECN7_9ACTN|nr:hypothetical protein Voc01_048130 [Virgisporangium ochraceum]
MRQAAAGAKARQTWARADSAADRAACERLLRQWRTDLGDAEIRWAPGVLAVADRLRRSGSGFRASSENLDRTGRRPLITVKAVVAGYASARTAGQRGIATLTGRAVETR